MIQRYPETRSPPLFDHANIQRAQQPVTPTPSYTPPSLETRVCVRLGWVIWALAVAAAAGCGWIRDSDGRIQQFTAVSHGEYDRACQVGILRATWCAICEFNETEHQKPTLAQ